MNPGTDWIEQGRRLLETLRSSAADAPPAGGEHGSDCRWCPVCQAAAVVRGERPEVTAALADVLAQAAVALRTFAEAGPATPPAPAEETAAETTEETTEDGAEDQAGEGATPAVQQIDIA
jgi:hypothetical protein